MQHFEDHSSQQMNFLSAIDNLTTLYIKTYIKFAHISLFSLLANPPSPIVNSLNCPHRRRFSPANLAGDEVESLLSYPKASRMLLAGGHLNNCCCA
ncbi:hypothetical protein R3W88_028385 [Solanum pinnatisectum]|uniref:Uncharacterized protein n=1 Tax=Solanum pinnatisectum TaxID=50273 RepID=A0AAV9LIS5_9SOLN|nr:hypothetical protein R3W88_028385 [Solanum pinnatisectum]